MSGLDVKGLRQSWRDPAQFLFAGESSRTSDESWYSNDLHMIVSERRANPFGEVAVFSISKIDRHEPPSSLFKVPQGYRVIRPKRQLFTSFGGQTWAITSPDYDPIDGSGTVTYNSYPSLTPLSR